MNSSLHILIPFLPLFCNCQLNSIPLLPSSCPGRLASRNSTNSSQLNSSLYQLCTDHAENTASILLGRRIYSAVALQRKLLDCCLRIRCRRNVFSYKKKFWEKLIACFPLIRHGPQRKLHVQQCFYCCVYIRCSGNVFTEPLPSNERKRHI
jgi:hypothetical protein